MISNKIATKRLLTEIYETLIPQYITSLNIVLEEELITIQLQNITIVINKNYPFHSPKVLHLFSFQTPININIKI